MPHPERLAAPHGSQNPARLSLLQSALGLGHLALHGAGQITELVAEMHETIAHAPLPLSRRTPDARRAPLPYRIVSGSFTGLAGLLGELAGQLPDHDGEATPDNESRLLLRAVLNGVMGDKLARWNSPLALPMSFHDRHGQRLADSELHDDSSANLTLILHGLCMHDRGWMNPAHLAFADQLERNGHRVAWIRYNSGLPIGVNGQELADRLQNLHGSPQRKLHLVGHSMGGLLMRSACHYAEVSAHSWLGSLESCAYLSTPHHGAPYERMGHLVNSVTGVSAYSRPFMRLGNIRSAAIRDLRYGNIFADAQPEAWDINQKDSRPPLPELVAHARHLLLGGGRDEQTADSWVGDGLVPVYSALGQHRDPTRELRGEQITRRQIEHLDHIAMLADERIYEQLVEWLILPVAERL